MTKEPWSSLSPDTNGRYYLLPMLDHVDRCVCFARLANNRHAGGKLLLTPPGWSGTKPPGMSRIDAPTPYVMDHRAHQD